MEIQMDKSNRIKELVEILNKASKAYYQDAKEIMTNFEYDQLYDELVSLEKETGIVLANSPTVNVGYEVLSELPKEKHASPMLSLDKTKEVRESGLYFFLEQTNFQIIIAAIPPATNTLATTIKAICQP